MSFTASRRDPWSVHAALGAAQTGFALFPVCGKIALASIPPLVFAGIRVVLAAVLLETIRRLDTREEIAQEDRRSIFLFALLGVSLNQSLFVLGLSLTTAINATILISSVPVFTLAVAVLLRREGLTLRAVLSLLLAGLGALLLLKAERFDWGSEYFRGDVLLLANALFYSVYLVLSRPILARYRVSTFIAAVFRYGAVPILLVGLPACTAFSPVRVPPLAWACLLIVILFCTVLPYFLNSWALARTEASRVAFYVFVQALIAATLAILILGEKLTARTFLAALLILSGLGVSVFRKRLPARPLP